jgi:uncharacterized protein YfiM (DUF2279 family)
MLARLRPALLPGLLVMAVACYVGEAKAQVTPASSAPAAAGASVPLRLDLSRRDLKNFLTDKDALAPYQRADGSVAELHDVFALGSVNARWAVFWDARSCRLLGILDLEAPPEAPAPAPVIPAANAKEKEEDQDDAESDEKPEPPSPYLFKATGPFPLGKTTGVSGAPRYFGFRLVKDVPEFLYTCGSLAIEERLWLDEGGNSLRQRFSAKDAAKGLQISVPETWKGRVTASAGTWKGAVLTVPKESAAEVILTYPLTPATAAAEPTTPATN